MSDHRSAARAAQDPPASQAAAEVTPLSPEHHEGAGGTPPPRRSLTRDDVYSAPVVAGRERRPNLFTRLSDRVRELMVTDAEREEAVLEQALRSRPGVTQTNTVAVLSPKGGVGKTTCTFLVGNLLSAELKLRCVAIDANPDFGTLGSLAPDSSRSSSSLAELYGSMGRINSSAELRPFVSALPTGLHIIAAPPHAEVMAEMTPELYRRLTSFLSDFYEVVLLDLGTGITGPLARFGVEQADQTVVVTTPEFVTAQTVLSALHHLEGTEGSGNRLTVVLNQAPPGQGADHGAIQAEFRSHQIARHVTIPYDQRLRAMIDSGTYRLEGLGRPTRMPVKELGLAVAEQLV